MSEELKAALARIACLEGEIAKRDEEMAACRVAVENCEVFRARIAELESRYQRDVYGLNNECDPIGGDPAGGYANDNARLRSELAAIKTQGVVMPERWNVPRPMWKDARQPYGNPLNHADIEAAEKFNLALDEVARLNAAPVQQVSVPDERIIPTSAELIQWAWEEEPEETRFQEGYNAAKRWVKMQIEAGIAAPAAPAADAWIPVSERLPGEDDQVLCWCEDETVAWAEVSSHHNSFFTDMTHELLPVTHWMPLPAAPSANSAQGVL